MRRPDPQLDSIIERIVLGEDLTWQDVTSEGELDPDDPLAGSLMLLSDVDRFHRNLHGASPAGEDDHQTTLLDAAEAPKTWGPLHIRGSLGRGGFGEVVRAWDPALQREVALKLLREDLTGRRTRSASILDEARTLAKVRHENVVTVYGVETHDGRPGYWMELVQGEDLEQHLQARGPASAAEAAQVGTVLCQALSALHRAGLVHRDVKTTNVVREVGGRLVLMDFGTTVKVDPGTDPPAPLSGTPLYMAPETLAGNPPDPRSDVYSLGVLLYRLVTGEFPFDPMPLDDLQRAHEQGRRRRLRDVRSDLPSAFCEVVERAIHPDPQQRYRTMGELELALSGTRTTAAPNRRRRILLAAGLALLVAGPWAVWTWQSRGPAHVVVDAAFHSLRDGQAVVVGDGTTVSVGDVLWLELTASREAHVYVLNRDDRGEVNLLFPLSGYDLQNPLPARQRHELPGRAGGARKAWRVSSEGGREEFVIVASAERLDSFEASLAALPEAGDALSSSSLALGSTQMHELVRGVAETIDLPATSPASTSTSSIFDAAQRLGSSEHVTQGTWVRKITLVHRRGPR